MIEAILQNSLGIKVDLKLFKNFFNFPHNLGIFDLSLRSMAQFKAFKALRETRITLCTVEFD